MSIPRMSFRTGSIQTCISSHPVFERMGFVLRYLRDDNNNFCSSQLSFLGIFLFTGFGFKCLAVCNRRKGLYYLSKRSKCSSFMTRSIRLLQKNAAFMICYLFCCCLPQNLDSCTDCSGCSSELLHCHGETHGLPTRSHPRQQKFRAMNGAHLASPIRGELGYAHWPQLGTQFIALLGTKFGAH